MSADEIAAGIADEAHDKRPTRAQVLAARAIIRRAEKGLGPQPSSHVIQLARSAPTTTSTVAEDESGPQIGADGENPTSVREGRSRRAG